MNAGGGTLRLGGGTGSETAFNIRVGSSQNLVLAPLTAGIFISEGIFDSTAGASNVTVAGNNGSASSVVTFNNVNSYTGGTTVNAATLLVNNITASGTGTGAVTVNNAGAILGGTGSIAGAVTVNGGAAITGGTNGSVGLLTLASGLTLSGTSGNPASILVDLSGATADKLAVTGSLNLGTTFDQISFNTLAAPTASSYQLLTYTGVLTGTFDGLTNVPAGYLLSYATPGEVDLVQAVPEPGTWAAGLLTLAAWSLSQRHAGCGRPAAKRRRRKSSPPGAFDRWQSVIKTHRPFSPTLEPI